MGTAIEDMSGKSGKSDGIIPRLIVSLFGYTAAAADVYDIELKVSSMPQAVRGCVSYPARHSTTLIPTGSTPCGNVSGLQMHLNCPFLLPCAPIAAQQCLSFAVLAASMLPEFATPDASQSGMQAFKLFQHHPFHTVTFE